MIENTTMIPFRARSRGSALLIGLLLLLVVTVLALAGMRDTVLQERMSRNMHDRNLAFQAAESALREGELFLVGGGGDFQFSGSGLCPQLTEAGNPCTAAPMQPADAAAWANFDWAEDSRTYDTIDIDGVAAQPRYVIERLDQPVPGGSETLESDAPIPDANVYRITARGVGGTDAAVVLLQSNFIMR